MPRKRTRRRTGGGGWANNKFILGLAVGAVLVSGGTGVIFAHVAHLGEVIGGRPTVEEIGANDTLYLETEDAHYMNRIFRERNHEIAFCGLIQGTQRRLEIWLADTVNATPTSIEYLTKNCPPKTGVLLHTRPNGLLKLSERDKRTLASRPEAMMCVLGGKLPSKAGKRAENLACYLQIKPNEEPRELVRIPVVLEDGNISLE